MGRVWGKTAVYSKLSRRGSCGVDKNFKSTYFMNPKMSLTATFCAVADTLSEGLFEREKKLSSSCFFGTIKNKYRTSRVFCSRHGIFPFFHFLDRNLSIFVSKCISHFLYFSKKHDLSLYCKELFKCFAPPCGKF